MSIRLRDILHSKHEVDGPHFFLTGERRLRNLLLTDYRSVFSDELSDRNKCSLWEPCRKPDRIQAMDSLLALDNSVLCLPRLPKTSESSKFHCL